MIDKTETVKCTQIFLIVFGHNNQKLEKISKKV